MNDELRNDDTSTSFFDRIKDSPRTVSALIIILIVAAAIYAFSGEPTPANQDNEGTIDSAADLFAPADEEDEDIAQASTAPTTPTATAAPRETIAQDQLRDMRQALPEEQRQDNAYVEKAHAGDGITHLARRASTRWLADNAAGYEITNEHRIYIEDYIQNKLGTERLSLDETRTISFDLIKEAVDAAGELNEGQLRNLSHYTGALK